MIFQQVVVAPVVELDSRGMFRNVLMLENGFCSILPRYLPQCGSGHPTDGA